MAAPGVRAPRWTRQHYRFGGVNVGGAVQLVTDLYLPFAMLGIADPAASPLDLIALASEEDALHLWATLPNTNPVNSAAACQPGSAARDPAFDLTQRYHWDQVGSGLCPNGSTGSGVAPRYGDTDLQMQLTADPAAVSYSFIQDGLAGLQDVLLGSGAPPADMPVQLGLPAVKPVGVDDTINYTLRVRNLGADTATGVTRGAGCPLRLAAQRAPPLRRSATSRRVKSAALRSARPRPRETPGRCWPSR